jgi:thiol-disulfide isomerase/thioredoxin
VGVLVLALVVGLLVVRGAGRSTTSTQTPQNVGADILAGLTSVPARVFTAVGVSSHDVVARAGVLTVHGQPVAQSAGKPSVLYVGAEYCPYCAAERWATIIALSRFGTWHGLTAIHSSTHPGEPYAGTPTFTFARATYSSPLLSFTGVELYTANWDNAKGFYTSLDALTPSERTLVSTYDSSRYIKGMPAGASAPIPFLDVANQYLVSGASYSPALLGGMTQGTIVHNLTTASNQATAAVLTTANYLSAALCNVTGQLPHAVCSSGGVMAAKAGLAR